MRIFIVLSLATGRNEREKRHKYHLEVSEALKAINFFMIIHFLFLSI